MTGVQTCALPIWLRRPAIPIFDETDVYEIVASKQNIDCVLVDEAQFLKKHHVIELTRIVDELGIPVMTFGLKNDFRNQLFEGSEYLLLYADKIEEMKTICWFCAKKATMNLRIQDSVNRINSLTFQKWNSNSINLRCLLFALKFSFPPVSIKYTLRGNGVVKIGRASCRERV